MSALLQGLEMLSQTAQGAGARKTPLLFVHGAHTAAWCWQEHYLPYFAARGWSSHALSLSGHGGSEGGEHLDALSIDDYVNDLRLAIASFAVQPVVIGHSMGGFVVQKYLELNRLKGAVLLCSVPPLGMMGSALGLAMRRPGLLFDLSRLAGGGSVGPQSIVEAMFHQPLPKPLLQRYFARMHGESQRAVWDMLGFNLPRVQRKHVDKLLVMGAAEDALIPAAAVRHTATAWEVEAQMLADIGHGVMLEAGWEAAAEPLASWLESHFE